MFLSELSGMVSDSNSNTIENTESRKQPQLLWNVNLEQFLIIDKLLLDDCCMCFGATLFVSHKIEGSVKN